MASKKMNLNPQILGTLADKELRVSLVLRIASSVHKCSWVESRVKRSALMLSAAGGRFGPKWKTSLPLMEDHDVMANTARMESLRSVR
jgi:hypothetical protein